MDSKKLLVFSDTHGCLTPLKAVFNWAKDFTPPNGAIHAAVFLGDGAADLRRAANETGYYSDWKLVRGNNDYETTIPDSGILDFAGQRFYICHGHRHSLFGNYHTLVSAARSNGANAVLFGHSHVPFQKLINGIMLINPGSVGRPRSNLGASFALVECGLGGLPKAEFWGIKDRGEIRLLNL